MQQSVAAIQPKRKSRTVSTFLKKTYNMLNDQGNSGYINWAENGIGFIIGNQFQFARMILPKYFKHSNYSSFVRQLNMYNFHKIRESNNENYFHHKHFDRHNVALLAEIKRKPEKKKKRADDSEAEHSNDQNLSLDRHCKENMSISAIDNSFEERLDEKKHRPKTVKRGAPKKNEDRKKCNRQVESEKLTAEKSVLETNHGISEAKVRSEKKTQEIFEEECLDEDDDIHSLSMEVQEQQKLPKRRRYIPQMATNELFCASKNNIFPISIENVQASTLSIFI